MIINNSHCSALFQGKVTKFFNESFKLFWFVIFEMLYLADDCIFLPCKLIEIHPELKRRPLWIFLNVEEKKTTKKSQ